MEACRGRKLDASRSVDVYRNLNRGGYSLRQGGLVVAYAERVALAEVKFVVSCSGWRRYKALGVRQVHAVARGRLVATDNPRAPGLRKFRYDLDRGIFTVPGGRDIAGAGVVALDEQGAFGSEFLFTK